MRRTILVVWASLVMSLFAERVYDQAYLEKWVWWLSWPNDDFVHFPEPDDVPERNLDAIKKLECFLQEGQWTTNQLVNGLYASFTNNIGGVASGDSRKDRIAGMSLLLLGEINVPLAHDLIAATCTNLTTFCPNDARASEILAGALPGMFRYTNMEPEVMSYLRAVSVQTNIYERAAVSVMFDLMRCVEEMPAQYRANATTNVAKFVHFAIMHNTSKRNCVQDEALAEMLPAYSNSVQRIGVMNHFLATITDAYSTNLVHYELARLQALPTNQLNNVSWLTEE